MRIAPAVFSPLVRRKDRSFGLLRVNAGVLTLILLANSLAVAQTPSNPGTTKQSVLKLGISHEVKVKEADGTILKGTLIAVNEGDFSIIPKNGGAPVTVAYTQVDGVGRTGMPKLAKITIWVVVGLAVAIVVTIAIALRNFH